MTVETTSEPLKTITFFGDASSKDSAFMVAGGFAVAGTRIREIEHHIQGIRHKAGISSEFHWSKYRGGHRKESAYQELVDYGFQLTREQKAALHVIIAPFSDYDHKRNAGDNRDTSVNRMYYQLCLHRLARFYGHARAIHVRLDEGNDCEDICNMRPQLCADAFRTFRKEPKCRANSIRSISSMDSKSSSIIQMADVLIGGIAAKRNGVTHKSAKGPLADYILEASGHRDWSQNTNFRQRRFTVWNFEPKEMVPRSLSQGQKP